MRKLVLPVILTLVLLVSTVSPVSAVTDGDLDGEGHPMVVLIVADVDGTPTWRCSGTLLSSTVVLTAGHCTYTDEGTITGMRIFYESDVKNGDNTYPYAGGPNSIEAKAWYTHPLFDTGPFVLHDVGVVVLKKGLKLKQYGKLPAAGQLDAYKTERGLQDVTFTAVGYGLQESFPTAAAWKENNVTIRMVAYPKLLQINVPGFTGDFSMLLSNNANTGGTCFGDSGGPNFIGNSTTVAGVTSFGINDTCAGTGGVFRLDRQDVLDFVNQYLRK